MARLPQPGEENWGETLNDYLRVSHASDGGLRPTALTASNGHVFYVAAYGAVGDGRTDDAAAIQAALDDIAAQEPGARLSFSPGVYAVGAELEIKSAVHLDLSEGTVIRRTNSGTKCIFKNFNASYSPLGYAGRSDICITGGVLDANGEQLSGNVSAIVLAHAERLVVERVTVRNIRARHAVEFNAVRQGVVRDCWFEGFLPGETGSYASEAVQIDGAFSAQGLPDIGPAAIDNTPCQLVTMKGCVVRQYGSLASYGRMVGSSAGVDGIRHTGIVVADNYAESVSDYAVRVINWRDALIDNNTFVQSNGGVAVLTSTTATASSDSLTISRNTFRGAGTTNVDAPQAPSVITVAGLEKPTNVPIAGIAITGNSIKGFATPAAIECSNVAELVVSENTITSPVTATAQNGIMIAGCPGAIVNANHIGQGVTKASIVIIAGQSANSEGSIITGNVLTATGPVVLEAQSCVVNGNSFSNPSAIGLLVGGAASHCVVTGNAFAKTAGNSANAIEVRASTALIQANTMRGWGKEGTAGAIRRTAVLNPNMATSTTSTVNLNRYA
jgi:hypothetical protein